VPPLMLKTAANPAGTPIDAFDAMRAAVLGRPVAVLQGSDGSVLRSQPVGREGLAGLCAIAFWMQGMQAGFKGVIDCIKAFSETDFTEDLKRIDVPTLIMHGADDDQIVRLARPRCCRRSSVKGVHVEGVPRLLARDVHRSTKDKINEDLLAFIRG
jgi:non-heme chloroperoxidase